jgi:glutathione synthase/RimK-type ligase-like ATP-grasp enzyme
MPCRIIMLFSDGQELETQVADAEIARFTHSSAHQWLGREFEEAGCVPINPMGKLLAADKVVGLAKSRTRAVFQSNSAWVRDYFAATAAALEKPMVTINLVDHTLGY